MSTIYIPNYEILKVLGEGGMAVVYLAEHRLLHNRVALKVLNREFVHNENNRNGFLKEYLERKESKSKLRKCELENGI
jgi:serine/threonine protein kinase